MNTKTNPSRARLTGAAMTALSLAVLAGCRGERSDEPPRQFIPDMDDSPKFRNQIDARFFEDGRSLRPRVPGSVAFGDSMDPASVHRANYLKADAVLFNGYDPAGEKTKEGDLPFVQSMPASVVDAWMAELSTRGGASKTEDRAAAMLRLVERGQDRFNIYCSACHGYEADGRGLVGLRWGAPPPSFHDPKYKDRAVKTGKDGYIFYTIQHGVPETDPAKPTKMPSYADKVNMLDSWAIVAYIRALQSARTDVPAAAAPAADGSIHTALSTEVTK
ncbi:MAG: c-type cytochrome [Phycisphaerales bacterium]|nr:c-type cytochrome [Phycisphaerales bacterium]